MDNKLFNSLIDLGLTENEARVYLNSLPLGRTTILKISKSSEVKRTTVYSVVDSLIQKGLMRVEQKGFKIYYAAEEPEKLEGIINRKKEVLMDSLGGFKDLYNNPGGNTLIKYYEGIEAVKNSHIELLGELKRGDDYFVISDSQKWLSTDQKYFETFIKERSKKHLNNKLLLKKNEIAQKYKQNEIAYNMKIKFLPDEVNLSSVISITPTKLMFHNVESPVMAMIIENKNIIKLHRELFEIIWKSVK